jgi:hypothetical protein
MTRRCRRASVPRVDRSRARTRHPGKPQRLPRDAEDLFGRPFEPWPVDALLRRLEAADHHTMDLLRDHFVGVFRQQAERARRWAARVCRHGVEWSTLYDDDPCNACRRCHDYVAYSSYASSSPERHSPDWPDSP